MLELLGRVLGEGMASRVQRKLLAVLFGQSGLAFLVADLFGLLLDTATARCSDFTGKLT